MKRISVIRTPLPTRRAGKLIIQAIVYMTLLSALLGLGGICLHAALRMDRSDLKDSFLIRSLLRCERQLRQDVTVAAIAINAPDSMTLTDNNQRSIVWKAVRGVLTRELSEAGQIKSRDQFPFPAGTKIEFQSKDAATVVVRIAEPSDLVKYAEATDGSTHRCKPEDVTNPTIPDGAPANRVVEIHLRGAR